MLESQDRFLQLAVMEAVFRKAKTASSGLATDMKVAFNGAQLA